MSWEIVLYIYLYLLFIDIIVTMAADSRNGGSTLLMSITSSVIVGIIWPIIYSAQIMGFIRNLK